MSQENFCINCKHYRHGESDRVMPDGSVETMHLCLGIKNYITGEVAKMRCETIRGKPNSLGNSFCKIYEEK